MVDDVGFVPAPAAVSSDSGDGDDNKGEGIQSDTSSQATDPESEPDSERELEVWPESASLVPKSQKKEPAWVDPDDLYVKVSLAANKGLHKLRDTAAGDDVGGHNYERCLRRQFEKLNPTPRWASNARKKRPIVKRKRSVSPLSSVSEGELDLFTSAGGILEKERSKDTVSENHQH